MDDRDICREVSRLRKLLVMKKERFAMKTNFTGMVLCALAFAVGAVLNPEESAAGANAQVITSSPVNSSTYHSSTLLADGRVLVVSGSGKSGVVSSTAIYDPVSQTWTATGALNVPRVQATATLLLDGRVLVAGGYAANGVLASAELFNPATGTWSMTGALNVPRWLHSAILLTNGEVLVAGGYNPSGGQASSELYNPATGAWTLTGNTSCAHWLHTTTQLANGNVLMAGGFNGGGPGVCEIYNPNTGTWTQTWALPNARFQHVTIPLANGLVLLTGGAGYNGAGFLADTELYDPATQIWTKTGPLNIPRFNPVATRLPDGRVLVAGGTGPGGQLASMEIYDPASGTWTLAGTLNNVGPNQSATLLADGQVLITGSFTDPTAAAGVSDLLNASGQVVNLVTVTLGNLNQTYDGTGKTVTVSTSPAGQPVNVTYNGSASAPVNAGSYAVVATISNPNYQGVATNTLVVGASPITLNAGAGANGTFQLTFTNSPGASFTVYSSSSLSSSVNRWSALGTATEVSPGVYVFTDATAGQAPQRFYRVAAL